MQRRLTAWMIVFIVAGCAQNQEQPTKVEQKTEQTQQNEGPDTPQTTTITVNVNGGHRSEGGDIRSLSSQPAEERRSGSSRDALATTEHGRVSAGGQTAGSNIVIAPIWIDSRGLQKTSAGDTSPRTGGMSPDTGAITTSNEGTQKPQADLNIPLSIAAGMNPSATSNGTQAARGGQVSGSPQTSDQSGTRSITQLKAASSGLQQLLDFFRNKTLTPELSAATTVMQAQKQAIDEALVGLVTAPASQSASQPAETPVFDFGNQ